MFIDYQTEEPSINFFSKTDVGGSEREVDIPENVLVLAKSGHGKNYLIYCLLEEKHNEGHIIVSISDPKNTFEFAFSGFDPRSLKSNVFNEQQILKLESLGKEPSGKDIVCWHPFTFNLKKQKHLPKWLKPFVFDIKTINRDEWAILLGVSKSNTLLDSLTFAVKELKDYEDLFDFVKNIENYLKPQGMEHKGKFIAKAVEPTFNTMQLDINQGDVKTLNTALSELLESNLFISSRKIKLENGEIIDNPYIFKVEDIFNHQEQYHALFTKFLDNSKQSYFIMFKFINDLIRNADKCKKPIDFFIDEMKDLVPHNPDEDYKKKTADLFSSILSKVRNTFKAGGDVISNGQNFEQIDSKVGNDFMKHLVGNLSIEDIGAIGKKIRLGKDDIDKIKALKIGEFIMLEDEEKEVITSIPSCHAMKHYGNDFFDIVKENKLEGDFSDVVNFFEVSKRYKIDLFRAMDKQRVEREKAKIGARVKAKEKNNPKLEELKEEIKQEKEAKHKDRDEKIIALNNEMPELSLQKLADKLKERYGYDVTKQTISNVLRRVKFTAELPDDV